MRIVIAGAGDVGFHLARLLSEESHDIIIIDLDGEKLNYIESHIDAATLRGNSITPSILKEAGIERSDLFIAATSLEATNLVAAMMAKKLGCPTTIARVKNSEFLKKDKGFHFSELGINHLISPQELAAVEIENLVKQSAFTDAFEFENGKLNLVGIVLTDASPLLGQPVRNSDALGTDGNYIPVAVKRGAETLIPKGDTVFQSGDYVYFISLPSGLSKVAALTGIKQEYAKRVMILGGSQIGINAAKKLCGDYKVKLVEMDKSKCNDLADDLCDVLVIRGDGHNVELLEEENIDKMDVFIAVTGNSDTNIMSCLVAKSHGVKKTIALVENMDYLHLSQNIGIDTMINKKLLAASSIFTYIRQGEVVSMANLHGVESEVLEFEVKANSKITAGSLRQVDFPKNAIVGGIVRNGMAYITFGDFQIKAGDRVVVVAMPGAISKVEKLFK